MFYPCVLCLFVLNRLRTETHVLSTSNANPWGYNHTILELFILIFNHDHEIKSPIVVGTIVDFEIL